MNEELFNDANWLIGNVKRLSFVCIVAFVLSDMAQGRDRVEVHYRSPADSAQNQVKTLLQSADVAESVAELLNQEFTLPRSLVIILGASDGPLYDPDQSAIWIPYDFVLQTKALFENNDYADSPQDLDAFVLDVVEHALYHEVGHALIELLQLPVTGGEEDAVDDLATVILIEAYEDGQEAALSAADEFELLSDQLDELEEGHFWDEHSLDIQRFHNIVCLVYGSNPERYDELSVELQMSDERAERCIETYAFKSKNWIRLLTPHLRSDSTLR